MTRSPNTNGPAVLLWATLLVSAAVGHALAAYGAGEDATRLVIRQTARISVLFFSAAFAASSLLRLWPAPWSRWMMRNRRWLGLSFALSHLVHLTAILILARIASNLVVDTATLIGGGLAYVFIALLAATSFDGAVRRLGVRTWRGLHKSGMYYIWALFTFSYLPRALVSAPFIAPTLMLVGVLGLRIAAHRAPRRTADAEIATRGDNLSRQRLP
jgi:DMSO/TMAO reductase YedYZ heme-binding membrane subunit